jgi:hypothetical protein
VGPPASVRTVLSQSNDARGGVGSFVPVLASVNRSRCQCRGISVSSPSSRTWNRPREPGSSAPEVASHVAGGRRPDGAVQHAAAVPAWLPPGRPWCRWRHWRSRPVHPSVARSVRSSRLQSVSSHVRHQHRLPAPSRAAGSGPPFVPFLFGSDAASSCKDDEEEGCGALFCRRRSTWRCQRSADLPAPISGVRHQVRRKRRPGWSSFCKKSISIGRRSGREMSITCCICNCLMYCTAI